MSGQVGEAPTECKHRLTTSSFVFKELADDMRLGEEIKSELCQSVLARLVKSIEAVDVWRFR